MYTRGIPLLLCFPPSLSASPFLYFFPLLVMCSVLLWLLGINLWHIKRCGGGEEDAWGEKFISILNLFAECLQRNIWESQRFIYVNCCFFCCFFYSTVMQLLLVKIEVGSVRLCTCAKNTHCSMQHMSVCAFVFVSGCSVTANIFTKRNREVRHWSLQHASFLLYHVHSGPHKVQTMSQPYIWGMYVCRVMVHWCSSKVWKECLNDIYTFRNHVNVFTRYI